MIARIRFLITVAFVCHLLLAPRLVTSQLLSAQQPADSRPVAIPPVACTEQEVQIQALEQEKDGPVYKLKGHVEIRYSTFKLYADEVTYNSDSGEARAEGHMVLDGGANDEHIEASDGTY